MTPRSGRTQTDVNNGGNDEDSKRRRTRDPRAMMADCWETELQRWKLWQSTEYLVPADIRITMNLENAWRKLESSCQPCKTCR
mmetsp:Transcript_10149/g.15170  ORF Transcript_10149/g.15170 Transcript_10149/m.15170 type:complete len:83 (-) Transcript_10149:188-436(-)